MLTELANQIKPETIYEKPIALIYYEKIKSLGIPLRAGGILQQPTIFMLEYAVVEQEKYRLEAINRLSAQGNNDGFRD